MVLATKCFGCGFPVNPPKKKNERKLCTYEISFIQYTIQSFQVTNYSVIRINLKTSTQYQETVFVNTLFT